jgi:GGDEF domain-containing protein
VDVRSSDEIGRLSDSFNLMAAEIREREARITELALRDAETGLPNHLAMQREIEARMARLAPGEQVVVGALGLDRFTVLRSAIGYALFTQLVREIGARVQVLDPDAIVGRLTTSTLCVISKLTALTDEVVVLVEQALVDLAAPVRLGGELVDVHMSNGLAAAEAGSMDAPRLIEHAMIALDQARASGRKVTMFDAEAYGDPAGNLSLMSEMLEASRPAPCSCTTSPSWTCAAARSPAWRPWCAGTIRPAACCDPTCSWAWPRKPATSAP